MGARADVAHCVQCFLIRKPVARSEDVWEWLVIVCALHSSLLTLKCGLYGGNSILLYNGVTSLE